MQLGEGGADVEGQATARRAGIHAADQHPKLHAPFLHGLDGLADYKGIVMIRAKGVVRSNEPEAPAGRRAGGDAKQRLQAG